jgi:hypothetical protein
MVFTIKGRELSYNNNGYNFTDDCKEYIVQLKPGDSFKVLSISYKLPQGAVGHAEDREYRIVD